MCDTAVVVEGGEVWFAKNSDRDPNEGQAIRWFPARDHRPGSRVACTWTSLPQVPHTHAVMLSQPFWSWGGEMGANEHGVVIGNEAVFTDQPLEPDGLTGLCLVRLALERATTAAEAVATIAHLVETHGQGGRCGLESASFSYSSSFLIADPRGAHVLETAGRRWDTRPVTGVHTISNALTLPALADRHADRLRGHVACAVQRRARTAALAAPSLASLASMLRDHGDARWPRYHPLVGTLDAPCMHGGGLLAASQTTASWITRLTPARHEHWATGTSSPCLSLFKPIAVHHPLDLGPLPAQHEDDFSLFWQAERLHRRVMRAPERLAAGLLSERDATEAAWFESAPSPALAWAHHRALLRAWTARLPADRVDERPPWARLYWHRRERWALPPGSGRHAASSPTALL